MPLAILAFGTNVLNHPLDVQQWRSTSYQWLDELWTARSTSIDQAARWLQENVQSGQSVFVVPNYMTYPLMYAAPKALYAWQIQPPLKTQFKDLPAIHFMGVVPPEFILAFGRRPIVDEILSSLKLRHFSYTLIKTFDIYWDDLTRPELFWRSFKPVIEFNRAIEGLYIWQRDDLKTPAH